jgi:hypothetical protein
MDSLAGDEAVSTLVDRVVADIDERPDEHPDYGVVAEKLNEGFALIATLYPEVYQPQVIEAVNDGVAHLIASRLQASG